MAGIRTLILDEWEVVRRGLREILSAHGHVQIVGEAADLDDALSLASRVKPAVILMDLCPPYNQSFNVVRMLHNETGAVCVAFTQVVERRVMNAWLDAGGKGYMPKNATAQEIVDCIRCVAGGKVYVSPLLIQQHADGMASLKGILSPREQEIAVMVATGYTSSEISARLHISPRTVENHRNRIKRRLGINSRAELVKFTVESGLLSHE